MVHVGRYGPGASEVADKPSATRISVVSPHDLVLSDAVDAVETLRREGLTVLLHCVQAQSRTPTVAALYGARHTGGRVKQASADVSAVLPAAHPNHAFLRALQDS